MGLQPPEYHAPRLFERRNRLFQIVAAWIFIVVFAVLVLLLSCLFASSLLLTPVGSMAPPLGAAVGSMLTTAGALGIVWLTRNLDRGREKRAQMAETRAAAIALQVECRRIEMSAMAISLRFGPSQEILAAQAQLPIEPIMRASRSDFALLPFTLQRACLSVTSFVDEYNFAISTAPRKGNELNTIDITGPIRSKLATVQKGASIATEDLVKYLDVAHDQAAILPPLLPAQIINSSAN